MKDSANKEAGLGAGPGEPGETVARGAVPEERNSVWVFSGLLGSVFATLCCIGIAPLVALVMAVGLGFALTLTVLLPLLLFFLGVGGYGLWLSRRRHGSSFPLLLHAGSGLLILLLLFSLFHGLLVWLGLAGILAASLWNIRLEYAYWHRAPEVKFPSSA